MSHRRCVPRLGWASQNSPSWQAKGLSCRAAGNKGSHCRTCRQRGEGGQGGAHRGGFFGKPLRVIFRFRHQNAQNPPSPLVGEGGRGMLTEVDFWASPCAPSPVLAIRTPKLPLLPLWEKGAGGMRGKGARECRTLLISPKNSTLARGG
jgi:hypothetical protein